MDCLRMRPDGAAGGQTLPAEYAPEPDPVHGLEAFMERAGHKPWDLFRRNGDLLTSRLIYHDRRFGTSVWMLDPSPTVDHCPTASVWPAWNVDASRLYVPGSRPTEDGLHAGWFFNADFSRLTPNPGGSLPVWDLEDPDIYFVHRDGQLLRGDARTGQTEVVARWDAFPRERVYGLTRDNRYVFLDTPNGGIWVTYTPGDRPILQLGLHDGRPEAPGPLRESPHPQYADTVMIANRNCVTETQEWGPVFRLRVGMLIDRETGEMEPVIAPLSGQEEYLRAYISDRVDFPSGPEWEGYRKHESEDIDELFQIYRYYPAMTHGHETPSPNGEYMIKDGIPTRLIRTRDGHTETFRLSPDGGHYHAHWVKNPRFFTGWVRGWHFGTYKRPENANVEFQVFTDYTFQPIVDTKHRLNGYYSGGDFSMPSSDQTKIHYGSSMTGRFKNYVAVMARPRPPLALTWEADGANVRLTWQPPRYHREIRGYLVYRSERSGDGYELLTPEPVGDTCWRDRTVTPGRAYFYVVTSLEQAGLESGYSEEATCAGVDLPAGIDAPLVVYAEAEASIRDLGTMDRPGLALGVDRRGASDWYYVYRHPESDRGEAGMAVRIPADGAYHVWARVRSAQAERTRWTVRVGDAVLEAGTEQTVWAWVRAGGDPVALRAGKVQVGLATEDEGAQIDLICLATDDAFTPEGPRPEGRVPPPAVSELRAENVRARVNRLTWKGPEVPGLSHYNVYASRAPITRPAQEHLIGSPTYGEFIDWGLRAGTRYYYAVTAVDRRDNESVPVMAEAETPPAEAPPVEMVLTFAEAALTGPFERSTGAGTRGAAYVVPEDPENNRAAWEVQVPREGTFYFWLRYLHRGSGGRGVEARQEVDVRLNGESITTLGGGPTDLHVPDEHIAPTCPLAPRLWTWVRPGDVELSGVRLPAGKHELVLQDLTAEVRYDALLITDEPSFQPRDGRLRQR